MHPVQTAFPDGTWTAGAVRAAIAEGYPWVLADPDDIETVDLTGLVPLEVRFDGVSFVFDPTDVTSVHDGVTTLVSQDGKRFIAGIENVPFWNVLGRQDAPPGSPALGDRYLVGTAPSGAWAGEADNLTIYTSRGWEFAAPTPGRLVYIRDEALFAHWGESAAWIDGVGAASIPAGSIAPAQLEWPMGMAVEEETATPPGGTPAVGTLYIVGTSATGAWAGEDTKVARADGAGGWTFLTPYDGAQVFDRGAAAQRRFNSTSGVWDSSTGVYAARSALASVNASASLSGSSGTAYPYSATTAPTTARTRNSESAGMTINYAASRAGALLEIVYMAMLTINDLDISAIGIWVDSESAARDWHQISELTLNNIQRIHVVFYVTALDASAHNFVVRVVENDTSAAAPTVTRRRMLIRELA